MIAEDFAPRAVASQSEMEDQTGSAPGRLIIEWTARL